MLAGCATIVGSLAGCAGLRSEPTTDRTARTTTRTAATTGTSAASSAAPLRVHVTDESFRQIATVAASWNVNPGPEEYPHPSDFGADTEMHAADYFAARRGLEPTDERGRPPFPVVVGTADASDNAWMLGEGRADLAGTGLEPTSAEALGVADADEFVPNVVAKGGRQVVVSREVHEAGVTALTPAEIRDIYAGRVENWREVGGPDREIFLALGAEATPNRLFQRRFLDGPETGVDERFGRIEQRLRAVREHDGGLTDVDVEYWQSKRSADERDGLGPLDALVDGERVAPPALRYPSVYGVPLFTREEPTAPERAFLDALLSAYGQRVFEAHYGLLPATGR
jgi:phosphate transport system substrate-binding protein